MYVIWLIVLLATVAYWWRKNRQKYANLHHLPGPKPLPILGNVLDMASSDPGIFFKKMRKWGSDYKDIYVLWLFNVPIINIYHPDDIETILSSSTLIKKSFIYDFIEPWLFRGLLMSDGSKWQTRRKILSPAFHFNILKVFSEIIEENSWALVRKLEGEVNNEKTDIRDVVGKFALDSICETAMGTKLDDESKEGIEYMNGVKRLGEILFERISRFYIHNDFIFRLSSFGQTFHKTLKTVHGFTKNVIQERRQYVEEHGSAFEDGDSLTTKRLAMLDLLLKVEKDGKIDGHGIHEEVETFMFEGHDTTYVGITFLLMLLANYPEYQEKVYAELLETFGESLHPASIEELNKLTYLNACVKEAQRLMPSVALISRLLTHDIQLRSCKVPAGTVCHIHILDLHRRADLWDHPLTFRPERFLAEEVDAHRHPFSYVPFSAGPRNCIGQKFAVLELKSVAAAMLRKFRLEPVTRPHEVELRADVVMRPHSPVYIRFRPRHT